MNRQQRREQIKTLTKKMRLFDRMKILHESKLTGLPMEELKQLKEHIHPDKEMQRIFNTTESLMREVVETKTQLDVLLGITPTRKESPKS